MSTSISPSSGHHSCVGHTGTTIVAVARWRLIRARKRRIRLKGGFAHALSLAKFCRSALTKVAPGSACQAMYRGTRWFRRVA